MPWDITIHSGEPSKSLRLRGEEWLTLELGVDVSVQARLIWKTEGRASIWGAWAVAVITEFVLQLHREQARARGKYPLL